MPQHAAHRRSRFPVPAGRSGRVLAAGTLLASATVAVVVGLALTSGDAAVPRVDVAATEPVPSVPATTSAAAATTSAAVATTSAPPTTTAPATPPPVVLTPTTPAAASVAAPVVAAPRTTAPAAPAPMVVRGQSSWTTFLSSGLLAAGGQAGCAASDGAVIIRDGAGTALQASSTPPTMNSQVTDQYGNVTTSCTEAYSVTVPRLPLYEVTFQNVFTPTSSSCSEDGDHSAVANASPGDVTTMPTISFFFSCLV